MEILTTRHGSPLSEKVKKFLFFGFLDINIHCPEVVRSDRITQKNPLIMQFLSPLFFFFLFLSPIIPYVAWRARRTGVYARIPESLRRTYSGGRFMHFYLPLAIDLIVFVLFVCILADPVTVSTRQDVSKKGIDIAIVFDISKSMLAEDIKPNRIGMAKKVMSDFIGKLVSDRLAVVLFAGKPFLSMPLTFDYASLTDAVDHVTTDSIAQQIPGLSGTAIGDGLLVAIDTLTQSGATPSSYPPEKGGQGGLDPRRERVIILLTDGEANMGVNPRSVAKLAAEKGVKIYTIGLGNPQGTELYVTDVFGQRQYFRDQTGAPIKATLDEKMLTFIAETTGGKYYNAQDSSSLSSVFETLSKLTKTEVKTSAIHTYVPQYRFFLLPILFLLAVNLYMRRRWGEV